jgi:hypothetical protein
MTLRPWIAVCFIAGLSIQSAMPQSSRPPVSLPVQEARQLNEAPPPTAFVRPGLTGIYAQLRADANSKTTSNGPTGRGHIGRQPHPPVRYIPYATPPTPPDPNRFNIKQIVVKFVEGSSIRLREKKLVVSKEQQATATQNRLVRTGLTSKTLTQDLAAFNGLTRKYSAIVGRATPQIDEMDLYRLCQLAETNTRTEQPDLNLFYFIHLKKVTPEEAQTILKEVQQSKIVETAYFQPIPFDAVDIPPTTTIDVTNSQGYFMPAPLGVDVNFARLFSGGRGDGVRIGDIEQGWNTEHEDLPSLAFGFGTNWGGEHGTAVLGELVAQENGFGATGIAPNASAGWSSTTNLDPFEGGIFFFSVAGALLAADGALRSGDIALIEQHFANLAAGPCPNMCNCGQFGFVAVETVPFEHGAITVTTGAGIVVVEAAGNGQTLVTPASTIDSGAIIVGASDSAGLGIPECFTNFGPRVNVRSWGDSVGSIGFGDDSTLKANGNDNRQWYTRVFSGTSSASPIVTGVAALVQGTRAAVGLPKLTSTQMRSLLISTGVPQSAGVAIGPQPDLRAIITSFIPDEAMFVSQSAAPTTITPKGTFSVKAVFQNSGGAAWTGDHFMAVSAGSGSTVWQSQPFTLGTAASPVMPGDSVMENFSLMAPVATGTYTLAFEVRSNSQVLAVSPPQTVVVASANTQFDNATLTVSAPGTVVANAAATATVTATNTGTTTWNTGYSISLSRYNHISLPSFTVSVPNSVAPGQSVTLTFTIQCNGFGFGGFSAQMNGPSGLFGQSAGQTVSCQ